MSGDQLEWLFTPSTNNNVEVPKELRDQCEPRYRPINLFVSSDKDVIEIEPVEYLIGYSNGLTSIGVSTQKELGPKQPITMQFGSWKKTLKNKDLYIGCKVLVKSYYQVTKKAGYGRKGEIKPIVQSVSSKFDLFYKARLFANSVACEWAITYKPQLNPTLGFVKEFWCDKDINKRLFFNAILCDQETEEELEVPDDKWPFYVKKAIGKEMPVILNWIYIDEPFSFYYAYNNMPTILPTRDDYKLEGLETVDRGKVLGWVDTKFQRLD